MRVECLNFSRRQTFRSKIIFNNSAIRCLDSALIFIDDVKGILDDFNRLNTYLVTRARYIIRWKSFYEVLKSYKITQASTMDPRTVLCF